MEAKTSSYAAVSNYRSVGSLGAMTDARPYDAIAALLATGVERINQAKGHLQRGEITAKGECIGKALGIVEGLTMGLDPERGGDIATNLAQLYDYIAQRLVQANLKNEAALLDEAAGLLLEIKSGWDGIPAEMRG